MTHKHYVVLVAACCATAVALGLGQSQGYAGDEGEKGKPKSPEEIKVASAKNSPYYGKWKTGELLAKYCLEPMWHFDKVKDRVEFRGALKKGGQELVLRFHVFYGWFDKSNTRKDWIVVDDSATLAGKALPLWRPKIFVDEYRLMAGDKNEK